MKIKIIILLVLATILGVYFAGNSEKQINNTSNKQSSGSTQQTNEANEHTDTTDFKDDVENDEEGHEINESMNGDIIVKDESFVTQLDAIFADIDRYMGQKITVEGIVSYSNENEFLVTRYYDLQHGDHVDEVDVGITASYDGKLESDGTWVKVTGTIDKVYRNDRDEPLIKVDSIEKLESAGQRKVTN